MRQVPLGDIARFIRGITFKPNDKIDIQDVDAVVCMRTKNVQGTLDESDLIALPPSFIKRKEQYVEEGDILVSSANSWNLLGKCCWVERLEYPATAGGFISILRAKPDRIFPRYLYYWFSSGETQHKVRLCGRQTTNISNLDLARCLQLKVPLPPLEEQKRIAAILDKADAIRKKRKQAIELADQFLRSAFLDMFGDPITNPKGWETLSLKEVANIERNLIQAHEIREGSIYIGLEDIDGSGRFLKVKPVMVNGIASSKFRFDSGCILYGKLRPYLRKIAMPDFQGVCSTDILPIRPRESMEKTFLFYLLRNEHMIEMATSKCSGANLPRVSPKTLSEFKIISPPVSEQKKFSMLVSDMTRIYGALEKFIAHIDHLFNSLSQRAFRGEL